MYKIQQLYLNDSLTELFRITYKPFFFQITLTKLDISDPNTLLGLFQDLLKVNASKPTGATGHQHSHQPHKLRASCQMLFLRVCWRVCRPLSRQTIRHQTLQQNQVFHCQSISNQDTCTNATPAIRMSRDNHW